MQLEVGRWYLAGAGTAEVGVGVEVEVGVAVQRTQFPSPHPYLIGTNKGRWLITAGQQQGQQGQVVVVVRVWPLGLSRVRPFGPCLCLCTCPFRSRWQYLSKTTGGVAAGAVADRSVCVCLPVKYFYRTPPPPLLQTS